jgi:AcrR family transcriptional regulator
MSTPATVKAPGVKAASQARSRATRDALIEALERLLRDRPLDKISIQELAKEAGCAVGSVYRRFDNKDAFLPVLVELASRRMTQSMRAMGPLKLSSEGDLRGDMAEIARRIWSVLGDEAHLLRAAHLRARLDGGSAMGAPANNGDGPFEALCDGARQAIDSALMRRRPEIKEKARRSAAAAAAYMIVAALLEKALYPDRAPARTTEADGPALAAMLGDMIGRSLRKI